MPLVKMLSSLCESEKILAIMDRGYDGLKIFEHCNRIENLNYLIRIRSGMTKEIKELPDKQLDLDLNFEVRRLPKRLPYKMKIQAWDMELPCTVSFRLVKVKLKDKWLVLATNLSRTDFPVHKFQECQSNCSRLLSTRFELRKNTEANKTLCSSNKR